MTTSLEYGNTRLRARKGLLLGTDDFSRLWRSETLEGMLGTLADTDYAPELEAALPRFAGLRVLDEALRSNLARHLRALRSFYPVDFPALDLLLERFDVQNLRTIIRAQTRLLGREQITPLLIPAGRLDDGQLAELASQPGPRATIDLMVAWGIPSRTTARRVLHRWPDYEASGEPAVLEAALNHAFAEHVGAVLGDDPDECLALLRTEIDATNLLTALRLRQGRLDREPPATLPGVASYLPAGTISRSALEAIEHSDEANRVSSIVTELTGLPAGWRPAIGAWAEHGSLVVLSEDLDEALTRRTLGLFHAGDPLGLAIPVAYIRTKENEVRNLRLIGRGIVNRLAPADIEGMLVMP